ncbi:SHOCT-like domain-containing protein [Niallia sp. 01092]|uniref:SHOCT-like domain-containing protein n=1 Tax=unclassified Niallia TaxID=2837522 RepID=UPI003FCFDE1B
MNNDMKRILSMVESGKITSEQAAALIDSFEETPKTEYKDYLSRYLRVRVNSETNDNVNVNVPLRLIKALLQTGHSIASKIPQAQMYVENIDIDLLISAIDNELVGQIVDVKLANGDTVQVFVE